MLKRSEQQKAHVCVSVAFGVSALLCEHCVDPLLRFTAPGSIVIIIVIFIDMHRAAISAQVEKHPFVFVHLRLRFFHMMDLTSLFFCAEKSIDI